MNKLTLNPIDVSQLEVFSAPADLRRDLHAYIDYIAAREVKRSYRNNTIPKADLKRLAKTLSYPQAEEEVKTYGESPWIDFVDWLALELGFVSYDTEGEYAGYSSSEPSFRDNYIIFNAKPYQQFIESSLAKQEETLLNLLLQGDYQSCEFFYSGPFGRLDGFTNWGAAIGVLPLLNFTSARLALLNFLKDCKSGVWYSVADLVAWLKANHPYFLIPQKPKFNKERWRRSEPTRYSSFHESRTYRHGHDISIKESDPDAFERVEGRYVERFFEFVPLLLQYADVAYGQPKDPKLYPALNKLQAFRLSERFLQVMHNRIAEPKVTVQPNFEIYIDSPFYSVGVLNQLLPLSNLITRDRVTILKLERQQVASAMAADESLEPVALLERLSGQPLPQNVRRELEEWAGHAEVFTLYEGFSLVEGGVSANGLGPYIAQEISPALRLVRAPQKAYLELEKAKLAPLLISHPDDSLAPLPDEAHTLFPKQADLIPLEPEKEAITLQREASITLHFPSLKVLQRFRRALVRARCPVIMDKETLSLMYSQKYQSLVDKAWEKLAEDYEITVEEIGD